MFHTHTEPQICPPIQFVKRALLNWMASLSATTKMLYQHKSNFASGKRNSISMQPIIK
jgi:hypothetical protein